MEALHWHFEPDVVVGPDYTRTLSVPLNLHLHHLRLLAQEEQTRMDLRLEEEKAPVPL